MGCPFVFSPVQGGLHTSSSPNQTQKEREEDSFTNIKTRQTTPVPSWPFYCAAAHTREYFIPTPKPEIHGHAKMGSFPLFLTVDYDNAGHNKILLVIYNYEDEKG